jgi:hypothetical protein
LAERFQSLYRLDQGLFNLITLSLHQSVADESVETPQVDCDFSPLLIVK